MLKRIKTSKKDFEVRAKSYETATQAFEEILTNQFFAPNVQNVKMIFQIEDAKNSSFWMVNDGLPMTEEEVVNAVSEFGCESANTAGNENGSGIKCSASYFTRNVKDSCLAIISKRSDWDASIKIITSEGMYGNYDDATPEQREFIDMVASTFSYGTATAVYKTTIAREDIDDLRSDSVKMLGKMLQNVHLEYNVNGCSGTVEYFDRHYLGKDGVETIEENATFEYNGKRYRCVVVGTNMNTVGQHFDEGRDSQEDWGVFLGYNFGYMPIHISNVELFGLKGQPGYYNTRVTIQAIPISDNEEYADVEDWKQFITKIGNVNAQKIPQLTKKVEYFYSEGSDKAGELRSIFESFYQSVVEPWKKRMREWGNIKEETKSDDEFSEEKMAALNEKMEKQNLLFMDETWHFSFENGLGEDIVKFYEDRKTIAFNFSQDSPLIKKLISGRNGRNGHNGLNVAISPIVDLFKIDIEDQRTTGAIYKVLKKKCRKINNYYSR